MKGESALKTIDKRTLHNLNQIYSSKETFTKACAAFEDMHHFPEAEISTKKEDYDKKRLKELSSKIDWIINEAQA